MNRVNIFAVTVTLILVPWLNSFGEIYKWTDENGNVVFSERKPTASKTDVETVTPIVTGGRNAFEQEDFETKDTEAGQAADPEARKREEQAIAEKNRKVEERNCKASRDRLVSLQRPRVNEVAEDGTRRVMGEDERQAEIAKSEAAVNEWCK